MIKANDINKAINWGVGASIAYFTLIALKAAVKRKAAEDYYAEKNGTGGIGAAERIKRRIYKEISLAQDAGIDFSKDYSQFTDEEIATLEELGHAASWEQKEQKPYAQAYYESLSKAYNAISGIGIGKAYDIKDANGNTVLTWIEDAASHVAHEREIEDARQRTLELEARAAEARKRKRATDRAIQHGQMSLFGCGYTNTPNYSLSLLNRYLSTVPVFDAQVVLNDTNKQGHYYVLCGDSQGGRDFYIAPNNLPYFREYCKKHKIEYEQFYLPDDALGYAPQIEDELWEIWREQIEYGETDYDYDTWRALVGDEYAKRDVIPYMR